MSMHWDWAAQGLGLPLLLRPQLNFVSRDIEKSWLGVSIWFLVIALRMTLLRSGLVMWLTLHSIQMPNRVVGSMWNQNEVGMVMMSENRANRSKNKLNACYVHRMNEYKKKTINIKINIKNTWKTSRFCSFVSLI